MAERGLPVAEVAARLGVSTHSLYAWVKRYSKPQEQRAQEDDQQAELRRLRADPRCQDSCRLTGFIKTKDRGRKELCNAALFTRT